MDRLGSLLEIGENESLAGSELQSLSSIFVSLHPGQMNDCDESHGAQPPYSPIHLIPVEVLVQIFLEVLTEPMSVPFDCAQLWSLGHVCARWRSIICSEMPMTWSNIKINFRPAARAARLISQSAEIIRICLQRTRDCLLTIAFTCASDVDTTSRDDWLRCLDLFVAVSERWKAIDLFIPITVLSRLLSAKGRLVSLEVLNLSLKPPNARSLPHPVVVFEDAPRLTSVAMSSLISPEKLSGFPGIR